uniref:Uncharacterized protein n=1 Tax=Cannabis sativa TaxID=3483 RepID=A0A803NRV6_CANSA
MVEDNKSRENSSNDLEDDQKDTLKDDHQDALEDDHQDMPIDGSAEKKDNPDESDTVVIMAKKLQIAKN